MQQDFSCAKRTPPLDTPPPPWRPDEADYSRLDRPPDDLLSNSSAEAIVASRSNAYLAVSLGIGAFSAAGLFVATSLVHRAMFASALISTVLSVQWSVRLLTATLRDQYETGRGWEPFIYGAWYVQKFSFWSAVVLTVITGIAPAP